VPIRVRVPNPTEFIGDTLLREGPRHIQELYRRYKALLKANGYKKFPSRAVFGQYFWLLREMGLIEFDHAEVPAPWAGEGPAGRRMPRTYRPRAGSPAPRHYYRIVPGKEDDPGWNKPQAVWRSRRFGS
jgi:hypothetical protein